MNQTTSLFCVFSCAFVSEMSSSHLICVSYDLLVDVVTDVDVQREINSNLPERAVLLASDIVACGCLTPASIVVEARWTNHSIADWSHSGEKGDSRRRCFPHSSHADRMYLQRCSIFSAGTRYP